MTQTRISYREPVTDKHLLVRSYTAREEDVNLERDVGVRLCRTLKYEDCARVVTRRRNAAEGRVRRVRIEGVIVATVYRREEYVHYVICG